MPLIKRYPNRKLYNTEAKAYITLDEITEMIRSGRDVQVVDHETGDDLTSLTLTQIILEQEKKSTGFMPRSLLTTIIRAGGDTLEHVVRSVQQGLGVSGEAAGDKTTPVFDKSVEDVLHALNVPSRRDLQKLQDQLLMLSARVEELMSEAEAAEDDRSIES